MSWTFLSNHGHVAVQLSQNPDQRISELAERVGITERRVAAILRDLQEAGYLSVAKDGRRNLYEVDLSKSLRHQSENRKTLGDLLSVWK
ncbi:MAG: winged helix-turn-helix domain-containing protein [Micrococcales bacterium]